MKNKKFMCTECGKYYSEKEVVDYIKGDKKCDGVGGYLLKEAGTLCGTLLLESLVQKIPVNVSFGRGSGSASDIEIPFIPCTVGLAEYCKKKCK